MELASPSSLLREGLVFLYCKMCFCYHKNLLAGTAGPPENDFGTQSLPTLPFKIFEYAQVKNISRINKKELYCAFEKKEIEFFKNEKQCPHENQKQ